MSGAQAGESELAERARVEPRCRVCRDDTVRTTVNDMLASGASYAGIVRALATGDSESGEGAVVTAESVRRHASRHFPVQQAARATYREIIERRARENRIDFIEGVSTALTPIAFMEVAMAKGFQTLVAEDTVVDVPTGLTAATRLQSILDERADTPDTNEMEHQVDQIIEAVRSVVPPAMWGDIVAKLDTPPDVREPSD